MLVKYNIFIDLQITSNSPKVNGSIEITCSDHIVSALVVLDVLLVATYVYGLYIFRSKLREYLSTFIETVSFDYCVNHTLDYIIIFRYFWVLYLVLVAIHQSTLLGL